MGEGTIDLEGFRRECRAWLERNPADGYERSTFDELDYEARLEIRRAWQRKLHSAGWVGISWPAQWGGRGLSRAHEAVFNEELGRGDAPVIVNDIAIDVAAPAILHWGTDAQRARWLPRTFSAEDLWCQGFSEPQAGSDMAAMATTARAEGDHFVLDGTKVWCSLGAYADLCLIIARSDPASSRHQGLTAFVVDMKTAGLRVTPFVQINGDSEFVRLDLEGVVVPAENRIGPLGAGWKVAMTSLAYERGARSNAYQTDQLVRALVEETRSLAEADPHAVPESVWDGIARLAIRARAVRSWEHRQYRRRLAGEELGVEASIGKLASSELAQQISAYATDLFGLRAQAERGDEHAIDGGLWARLSLTSRYYTIASGTSEVQRNIVSERLLGLPKGS